MYMEINKEEIFRTHRAQKFALWLSMIGMFMLFASLSSAFIVYTASGVDKGIKTILPSAFIYSTIVIVLSSVTIHFANKAVKKEEFAKQKTFLLATIVLGVLFFVLQLHAWSVLIDRGIYFINTNASQSFVYIFTGMHLAHIIGGLLVLIRCLIGVSRKIPYIRNLYRMELAVIFWHFLDIIWIYLYVFLLLYQ